MILIIPHSRYYRVGDPPEVEGLGLTVVFLAITFNDSGPESLYIPHKELL